MNTPVFDDKNRAPGEADLAAALGATKTHWDSIIATIREICPNAAHEWKFYGAKYGWQLKIVFKKKALVYMIPHRGSFNAALALRPPAIAALRGAGLPDDLVREIETAKESTEGRPARVVVSGKKDAGIVKRLLEIKLEF